jgi:hypothetical protein
MVPMEVTMRPAEWRQEVRMKRFREVYGGWRERRLSQEEAARILGVSDRTFRRYVERYVENVVSTGHVDRAGDIVRAGGVRIAGKPVVLVSHGQGPAGTEPVAKPLSIKPGEHRGVKALIAKTQFFPDERGRRLFGKVKQGFLTGWSIGFTIIRSEPFAGGRGRDIKEWNLLEYSLVGVPANPYATTLKSLTFWIAEAGTCCGSCTKGGYRCGGHREPKTVTVPTSSWRWAIR